MDNFESMTSIDKWNIGHILVQQNKIHFWPRYLPILFYKVWLQPLYVTLQHVDITPNVKISFMKYGPTSSSEIAVRVW